MGRVHTPKPVLCNGLASTSRTAPSGRESPDTCIRFGQFNGLRVFTQVAEAGPCPGHPPKRGGKNPRGDTPPAFRRQILSGSFPLAAIDPRCRGCRLFNPQRRGAGRVPTAIHRTQARPRYSMHHWSWPVQPSDDRALELLAHKIDHRGARDGRGETRSCGGGGK